MRLQAELASSYGDARRPSRKSPPRRRPPRDGAMLAESATFKHDLIAALSDELADARHDLAMIANRYGDQHSETVKADARGHGADGRDQRRSPPHEDADLRPTLPPLRCLRPGLSVGQRRIARGNAP